MQKLGINPGDVSAVLLTHTDGDHVGALGLFDKAKLYMSKEEEQMINGTKSKFLWFGNSISRTDYTLLEDRQKIQVGNLTIEGILVPGHTSGMMAYLINNKYLFTGDILSLKDSRITPIPAFFDMDHAQAVESMDIIRHIPSTEYIFTAHWGYTDDYPAAVYGKIQISDDIQLIQISEKAYIHISVSEMAGFGKVSSNGLIFVNDHEALLFDTPATDSQTETLVKWIADSLSTAVTAFVPTHWHDDCIGGLGYIHSKGITSYANQMTVDLAKANGKPVPQNAFTDFLQLGLHGDRVECHYLGGGHTADNIVVWIQSEKILFAGCMVKDIHSKGLGNLSDAKPEEWLPTIQKVTAKFPDAEIVIPGHGQMGGRNLLEHTGELLRIENKKVSSL
jgi:metallo-beta-lactamase class B